VEERKPLLNDVVVPAVVTGSLYGLVATAFNVLDRTTRVLNFAHGDLAMWAPMGALVAYTIWGWPTAASIAFGVVCSVVLGVIVQFAALNPFIGKITYAWILTGLGASLILEQLAQKPFNGDPQSFPLAFSQKPTNLGPFRLSHQSLALIVAMAAVVVAMEFLYHRTNFGRRLIVLGQDVDGAQMVGISARASAYASMVVASLILSVAGLLIAPIFLVSPSMGFKMTFIGFVAVALGGLGAVHGGVVGGLIVGGVIQVVGTYIGGIWTNTALFGLLLAVYLVRPFGLFGSRPLRSV
jgi:branched-chain amino acid transport system permease protein